jgi:putative endopeptidase
LADWKSYLRWNIISGMAPYLNKAFSEEGFRFSSRLTGQKQQSPRWRRVQRTTESILGEVVGQLFVAQAFPPEAKKRALTLVQNIKAALRERLLALDWMGEETRKQALRKLDAMQIKVVYPDKWRDYSGLTVGTDSYAQNILRASEFEFKRNIAKAGKPVDRKEWLMTPPTVNAYYNPQVNEIVFPAGILQRPFFDAKADDASNYGAIGAVIGHEITHGFDDQGRQFDAEGNLKDWWTAEDAKRFKERGEALVKQYSAYPAIDKVFVNGELTQGENIADLGGLMIAYQAWQKSWRNKSRPEPQDGFTPEQRFFLAFGQIWRFKSSPEYARLLANLDAHSPARWRVLGTLVNVPAFVEAFGSGDPNSIARPGSGSVKIW